MEIELDDSLLTARTREDLTLLALCAFGLSGRHRIVPMSRPAWDRWAAGLPVDLADEVALVWDEGQRRAALGPASERVTVVPTGPDQFDQVPLRLTPTEALGFLGRPLRVFLENGRNDRAFLLAFADTATRTALIEAEHAGWLVFETAGGVEELALRVNEARGTAPREVFRTMYLCDSDARVPADPSTTAAAIDRDLVTLGGQYHRPSSHFGRVLTRRAAENYAPPGALRAWAAERFGPNARALIQQATRPTDRAILALGPGAPNSPRRHLLAAIAIHELSGAVRAHLDMKEGRLRQGTPPNPNVIRTVDAVWNQLDAFQQAALLNGFGSAFSASFYGTRTGLADETGEIVGFLAKIMERV